jgi:hypothetical protein
MKRLTEVENWEGNNNIRTGRKEQQREGRVREQ